MTDGAATGANTERFWRWCLCRYESALLRAKLLRAQDEYGMSVIELLFAAWLTEQGYQYLADDRIRVESVVVPWEREILKPLRARRRQWKQQKTNASLYASLQTLELAAERQLAAQLFVVLPLSELARVTTVGATDLSAFAQEAPSAKALLAELSGIFVQLNRHDTHSDSGES